MIATAVVVAFAYLLGSLLVPYILRMLTEGNLVRPNFRGEQIPVGAGILLPIVTLPCLVARQALATFTSRFAQMEGVMAAAALVVTGFSLLGLLDDTVGNGHARGLGGHLRALARGELTTGALKAIYGGVLALLAAWIAPRTGPLLLAAVVISLFANTINLFDLRPGRALKVFLLGYVLIALSSASTGSIFLLMPAAAAALLPWDLQAKAMLGDTGANLLGAWLGLFLVTQTAPFTQWLALLALAALHIYAERHSLTSLIAEVPALSWFDMLGRR